MKFLLALSLAFVSTSSFAGTGSCTDLIPEYSAKVCAQIDTTQTDIITGFQESCIASGAQWSNGACAAGAQATCSQEVIPAVLTIAVSVYNLPATELEQIRVSCINDGGVWK